MVALKQDWRWTIALFCLALIVRFGFTFSVAHSPLKGVLGVRGDALRYQGLSLGLARENIYITSWGYRAYRPPAFPFFLAAIFRLWGGANIELIRIVQFLLGGFSVVFFYLAAKKLFGLKVSVLAGILIAFWPGLIYYSTQLLSETLFIFLLSLFLYSFYCLQPPKPWYLFALSGISLGLAALCRPIMASFALFLLFITVWPIRIFAFGKKYYIFYLFFLLTLVPWTARNYLVLDEFVLISTNGGINFLFGNNELNQEGGGLFEKGPRYRPKESEVAEERAAWKAGLDWIKNNPYKFGRRFLLKIGRFWTPRPDYFSQRGSFGPYKKVVQNLLVVIHLPLFVFFIIGIICLFTRKVDKRAHLLWLIPFYFSIFHSFFFVLYRFRLPVEPLIIIVAAYGFWSLAHLVKARS